MQKNFIHDLFENKYDEKEWEASIERVYNNVFNQELTTDDLILVKALTKMPEEYKGDVIDKQTTFETPIKSPIVNETIVRNSSHIQVCNRCKT